jgi:hypothetical protein
VIYLLIFLPKKKANNNLKEVYVRQRQVKEKKKECNYIVVVNIKKNRSRMETLRQMNKHLHMLDKRERKKTFGIFVRQKNIFLIS